MPLLALAIWANRAGHDKLWLLILFVAMGCRDGLTLVVIGFAIEQALRQRWRQAVAALLLGGGWLLVLAKGLYPSLNDGAGPAALGRYQYLGDGPMDIIYNFIVNPAGFILKLDSLEIFVYLFLLCLSLFIFWRCSSLPLIAASLPLVAANCLSSWTVQRDLSHQYSLPLAIILVVASLDGLVADKRHGRSLLLVRPWSGLVWASLAWVILAQVNIHKPQYFFSVYLHRLDWVQPVKTMIAQIPPDAAVLTHNEFSPHLTHRPMVQLLSNDQPLTDKDLSSLDVALLSRRLPARRGNHADTEAMINRLVEAGWTCEEDAQANILLCQP